MTEPRDQIATIVGAAPAYVPPEPEDVARPEADEEARPRRPRSWGYSTTAMNAEWALVLMGSKAVMVREQDRGPIEDRVRVLSVEAFSRWHQNRKTQMLDADGEIRTVTWAHAWLEHKRRRQYSGIEFQPDPGTPPQTEGYLNLWRGFAVKPAPKAGGYDVFRDHLLNNVCDGNPALYDWVFGWFAHIVQRPRERIGTALVMRGKMGTGKTKVGEVIGSLFPAHYFMVDDGRYVTGQFNAHMASCLLLQAEEAVWAGDKTAEGRLKSLVTATKQMIEAKGVDPIRLDNFVRLLMTSNEDWVVPAGKDERRFCVLDINPRCAQNHDYFREMEAQLDDGGRAALLHDLLAFDLAKINLRLIPRTGALLEQKLRSLDSVESWWFERLMSGAITRASENWRDLIRRDLLFDDYIHSAERVGIRRRSEETTFGMKLRKLVPGMKDERFHVPTEDGKWRRVRGYRMPPLDICREAFVAELGQDVNWPVFSTDEEESEHG